MSGRAPEPAELPIVVTGAGVVTAAARGRAAFAAALAQTGDGPRPRTRQAGESPRTRIEGFDVASLPEAKSLRRATPHALFGLAAAAEALAEAGGGVAPEESAVLVASTLGAANFSYRLWQELVKSGPLGASPMLFSEGVPNALVGHAARLLRLLAAGHMIGGGNGCGLRALAVARDLLECGRARRALVGAAEEWSELAVRSYARFGIVAREGAPRRAARGIGGQSIGDEAVGLEREVGVDFTTKVGVSARQSPRHPVASHSPFGRPENARDGGGQAAPLRGLSDQPLAAGFRQLIEPRLAIGVRGAPFGPDPFPRFEALQRRIERAVIDDQRLRRLILDGAGNALAMLRTVDQRLEDEHVERALQQRRALVGLAGGLLSGRHSTRVSVLLGRMSTQAGR